MLAKTFKKFKNELVLLFPKQELSITSPKEKLQSSPASAVSKGSTEVLS